jgi:hypothetical protein
MMKTAIAVMLCAFGFSVIGAELPKAPVPKSPYLPIVYRYADTMLEKGRDTYGPQKSGLFLSALDRVTLAPLTNRPAAPFGVPSGDRVGTEGGPLVGANPQHDENLLRLLYTLSELSSKPKYREAADAALKWFLENTASPDTGLLPWGVHLSWNVVTDEPGWSGVDAVHEFFRPWMLWERCFDAAPNASRRFALGLWEHQIADHATGAFDRHAGFARHAPGDARDFPRHAGFYIRTWAVAYARTKDDQFLKALEVLFARFEKKRHPKSGLIEGYTGHTNAWADSTLSLAIDCDGAASLVPGKLSSRLRAFAAKEDEVFCSLAHEVRNKGGFATTVDAATARPQVQPTPLWAARYDSVTTAQMGMMCVSRYENTGKVGYRELIHAAADAYMKSLPAETEDAWPGTFGQAISLQVAAWRSTAKPEYLDRARALADFAVEKFFDQGALPRASLKSQHYETITGADTLALGLVELHLHILAITAVRCPPNTSDR